MKAMRRILTSVASLLIIVALFIVLFVTFDIVELTPNFFLELSLVMCLTLCMKLMWYDAVEEKILTGGEIKDEKDKYFRIVDTKIKDINDFEKYLVILNKENKDHFVKTYIGSRTANNMAKKTKWMCFWHPKYRKMSKEDIGDLRYTKLYIKAMRKADKIKPINSDEIMALTHSEVLYDSKNHLSEKKRKFQIFTTLFSFLLTTGIAMIGVKEFIANWNSIFRFVAYLCAIVWTIAYTIINAGRTVRTETMSQIDRLKMIVDKYATYKLTQGGVVNE